MDLSPTLRRRWPLPLLLVSLALTAVAAIDAHRAVVSQDATVARAMREFSSFAAWSYSQHVQDRLSAMLREALGAVNHGDNLHMVPPVPHARNLAHYLPFDSRCNCHRTRFGPNPASLFAFKLGDPTLDVAVNTHPHPLEGWEVDRQPPRVLEAGAIPRYSESDKRWIVDTLTRLVRSTPRPDRGFTLVVANRVLGYTLMPTAWGDTLLYGAEYARGDFVDVLTSIMDLPDLLPATFIASRRNRDVIVARVWRHDGVPLFDSAPADSSTYASSIPLKPQLGGMTVELFVRPQQASGVVFGGMPRSHLPFLLGVLALAAALSVVAVFQLRREQELARMRSDFVANVSHELRTPLAQIRLYSETLRFGRARTAEQRDWSLGHIERETSRLSNLVDNILRFSRVGRPEPSRTRVVDLAAETEAIVEEFRPLAASRQVTIDTQIDSPAGATLTEDALRRVLVNLLDNAVKYGPAGQRVRVSLSSRNGDAEIAVTDQGPGVPASEREFVWLPFQRGRAAASAAGSGIGLSVVRDIAQQNGGRAWVETAAEGGARFVVSFPAAHITSSANGG